MNRPQFAATALGFTLAATYLAQAQQATPPSMVVIEPGEFEMGSDRGASWERPPHRVRTPKFEIGARPVTNAEFAEFKPGHVSPGEQSPAAPVTGVTWQDASDYCAWLGRRTGLELQLPYEAWWERAARGGLDGADYPWGDEPLEQGAPPPPNAFGVYAVGYNLWEWAADWYSPNYFSISPMLDPRGPERGVYRVLRGGGYRNDLPSATVFNRGSARPDTSSASITFRIARSLDAVAAEPTVTSAAPAPQPPPSPAPVPTPPARTPPKPAAGVEPLAAGSIAVSDVSFEASGSEVIITLQTASQAAYKTMTISGPDRVVVDIPRGDLMNNRKGGQVRVGQNGVKRIRYSQFQLEPPAVRVVIDLDGPMASRVKATATEVEVRLRPKNR